MTEIYTIEQTYSDRKRTQLRLAAEIIGIDESYLSRMLNFFVARVHADRRLGTICGRQTWGDVGTQVEHVTAFWFSAVLHTGEYSGNLVDIHRNLPGIRRDDFERWLALFCATVEETAPTSAAANYLIIRAERIARNLETAIFEGTAGTSASVGHQRQG